MTVNTSSSSSIKTAASAWASRPAEERYWTLSEAATAARSFHAARTLAEISSTKTDIITDASGVPALRHLRSGNTAALSPLAVEQLSRLTQTPAGYIQTLPAALAAQCLQHGWERRESSPIRAQVLDAGLPTVRIHALTGVTHDLTPNAHILQRLADLVASDLGWRTPPARVPSGTYSGEIRTATQADCLAHAGHPTLSVTPGTLIAASGTYLSDRDCFALLVDDSERGQLDAGAHDQMSRFLIIKNSEVGLGALDVTTGWLRSVCGNHILWGCEDILNMRMVHSGQSASNALPRMIRSIESRSWSDDRAEMSARIVAARALTLAPTKEKLIDLLFQKRITTRTDAARAVETSERMAHLDGEPLSCWSTAQALTRLSQESSYRADRLALDSAAAKVLALSN